MTNPALPPSSNGDRIRALIAVAAIALVVLVPLMMVAYMRAHPPQASAEDEEELVLPKKLAKGSKKAADDPTPPPSVLSKPTVALVLLLRAPYTPGINDIRTVAQKAFGERIGSGMQDENFVIQVNPTSYAIVMHGKRRLGTRFTVTMASKPYESDLDAWSQTCPNMYVRPLIKQHTAWFAVDFAGDVDESNRARVYQMIGQLLSQFAGNNCLAIYAPESGQFRRYDAKVPGMLSGGSPVDDFVDHVPTR